MNKIYAPLPRILFCSPPRTFDLSSELESHFSFPLCFYSAEMDPEHSQPEKKRKVF